MITTSTATANTSVMTVKSRVIGNTIYSTCPKCNEEYIGHSSHSNNDCYLVRFREIEAPKYGLISIFKDLNQDCHYDYVAGNLKNVYPRIKSKCIMTHGKGADVFVEAWAAEAIRVYIRAKQQTGNGYAGMHLAEYLDKMALERYAKSTTS